MPSYKNSWYLIGLVSLTLKHHISPSSTSALLITQSASFELIHYAFTSRPNYQSVKAKRIFLFSNASSSLLGNQNRVSLFQHSRSHYCYVLGLASQLSCHLKPLKLFVFSFIYGKARIRFEGRHKPIAKTVLLWFVFSGLFSDFRLLLCTSQNEKWRTFSIF